MLWWPVVGDSCPKDDKDDMYVLRPKNVNLHQQDSMSGNSHGRQNPSLSWFHCPLLMQVLSTKEDRCKYWDVSVYLPTSSNVVIIAGQPRLAVKRSQRLLNQATGHIVSCFNLNMHSPTRNVLFEGKALFLYVYSKDSSGLNHHWADPLVAILTIMYTSSAAQGGGGSFSIGDV